MKNMPFFAVQAFLLSLAVLVSCNGENEYVLNQYSRAKNMYAQGRLSEASGLLAEIKNFAPGLLLRAKAEYFLDNLEQAEVLCRKALMRRPSMFEAKLYLARILGEKGDIPQAEEMAMGLLADNPHDIRALRFASEIAVERGKNHEAKALLDQAAELSVESAMVFLDRARLHWIAGRGGEALEDLDKAKILFPEDTPALKSVESLQSIIREALK